MSRNTLIQVRRGNSSSWTSANSVLDSGEIGFETDTGKFKIGDGTTAWVSLTYGTDASKITGTTLSSSVTTSSLTSVGTLSSGSIPATLLTGTVASARLSGSYTGITGVGTLSAGSIPSSLITGLATSATTDTTNASNISSGTLASARISGSYTGITAIGTLASITIDGASSPSIRIGDWTVSGGAVHTAIEGYNGYILMGNTSDRNMYIRNNAGSSGYVYLGANEANQLKLEWTGSVYRTTIDGEAYCSSWWRSTGATGWYNQTYGGGIFMDDSSTVKVYNGKNFYVPGTITSTSHIYASGFMQVSGQGIAYPGASVGGGSSNLIGFRWASPYVNCTVDNVISAACANFSDARLKTGITNFIGGLDIVKQLRPISYDPLDVIGFDDDMNPIIGDNGNKDTIIGFLADDVQQIFPSAVLGTGNQLKSIDLVQIVTLLTSSIQNIDERLTLLETTNGN